MHRLSYLLVGLGLLLPSSLEAQCSPNPCGPGTCVVVTSGGYTCACDPGYDFNGGTTCRLSNECSLGTDDCVGVATCSDPSTAVNDFVCTCPSGYVGDGRSSGSGCTDVDECATGTPCAPEANCTNLFGSFACTCGPGWMGDGMTCTDVDECADAPCSTDERCTNQIGAPPLCECEEGFARDTEDVCQSVCGDGLQVGDEACDDGDENADDVADACRTDCRLPFCGDGVIDTAETCDPGGGPRDASDCTLCASDDAGAGTADAGVTLDAAIGVDAGARADGGSIDAGRDAGTTAPEDAGCSCRTARRSSAPMLWPLLVLAALLIRRR